MVFFIPAGIFLADRCTKIWALQVLSRMPQGLTVWPGVFRLYYAENTGMAFGLLGGQRWLLVALSLIAGAAALWALRSYRLRAWARASLLVVGGGMLGNLADRVFLGYVVDMIDVTFVRFAVFNVADMAITLGTVFLCISLLFRPGDWEAREGAANKA